MIFIVLMSRLLAQPGRFCQPFSAKVLKFKSDHSFKCTFVSPARDGKIMILWKYEATEKTWIFHVETVRICNYWSPYNMLSYQHRSRCLGVFTVSSWTQRLALPALSESTANSTPLYLASRSPRAAAHSVCCMPPSLHWSMPRRTQRSWSA